MEEKSRPCGLILCASEGVERVRHGLSLTLLCRSNETRTSSLPTLSYQALFDPDGSDDFSWGRIKPSARRDNSFPWSNSFVFEENRDLEEEEVKENKIPIPVNVEFAPNTM